MTEVEGNSSAIKKPRLLHLYLFVSRFCVQLTTLAKINSKLFIRSHSCAQSTIRIHYTVTLMLRESSHYFLLLFLPWLPSLVLRDASLDTYYALWTHGHLNFESVLGGLRF